MIFNHYIHSLSHQDALNISIALTNAFVIVILTILGFVVYEFYEGKKDALPDQICKMRNDIPTTEHILIEYGTDQFAIEIHHYTNPSTAEFLRHLKTIQWGGSYVEFTNHAYKLVESMECLQHPNLEDMCEALDVLLDSEEYSEDTIQYVFRWLTIAKTYWMLHPEEAMIPLEVMELSSIDSIRMKSKSF